MNNELTASRADSRRRKTGQAFPGKVHSSRPVWVLTLASVAALIVALDQLVVATALTTIRKDLNASVEGLQWTVNAYDLCVAALLLPAAALGDRFGRRRMFAVGVATFGAASAVCGLSSNLGLLVAARAVQGAGAALVMSLSLALVSAAYPEERRGAALGIVQGVLGLGLVGGPVLGGAVAGGLDWHWIFWINVPLAALVVPLVFRKVTESRGTRARLDLAGLLLVTAAVVGVVFGLVRGNQAGWSSAEVIGALLAGTVLAGAFVARERHAAAPMLPLALFRSRPFSAGNAAAFAFGGSVFIGVFFIGQYLQTAMGYSPLGAGLRLLPWTAGMFFIAPIAGKLADRIGERLLLAVGLTLCAAGFAWLALVARPGTGYPAVVPALILACVGGAFGFPATATAALRRIPVHLLATASGANGMLRQFGGVLGVAVGVAAFAGAGSYSSPADFTDGFAPAMIAAAGLALLGALAGLAVPSRAATTLPPQAGPTQSEPAMAEPFAR
jgi:EmrB/QacA subfamily drug resistance transporter